MIIIGVVLATFGVLLYNLVAAVRKNGELTIENERLHDKVHRLSTRTSSCIPCEESTMTKVVIKAKVKARDGLHAEYLLRKKLSAQILDIIDYETASSGFFGDVEPALWEAHTEIYVPKVKVEVDYIETN